MTSFQLIFFLKKHVLNRLLCVARYEHMTVSIDFILSQQQLPNREEKPDMLMNDRTAVNNINKTQ